MRRSYLRWGQIALVWTVCVLMFLDSASACRFRRRGRDCWQPVATCGTDAKSADASGSGAGGDSGSGSGFSGAGAGVEAPPPPAPAVEPVKPAAEPLPEKPAESDVEKPAAEKPEAPAEEKPAAEPAPDKPAAETPAAKQDDFDDLFNDAPRNPPKPVEKPAAETPAEEPAAEPVPEKPAEEVPPPEKPAEKQPAPKAEDDDPFKISTIDQLAIRNWTDNTGTYQIKGRLIAVSGGKVRILKETGKTTTVPLARLSAADRSYVNADFVLAARQ